jgi:hypothetical protein
MTADCQAVAASCCLLVTWLVWCPDVLWQGTGQIGYGIPAGDGFVTDPKVIARFKDRTVKTTRYTMKGGCCVEWGWVGVGGRARHCSVAMLGLGVGGAGRGRGEGHCNPATCLHAT